MDLSDHESDKACEGDQGTDVRGVRVLYRRDMIEETVEELCQGW